MKKAMAESILTAAYNALAVPNDPTTRLFVVEELVLPLSLLQPILGQRQ